MTLNYFFGYYFVTLAVCLGVVQLVGGLLSIFWRFDRGRRIRVDFERIHE